MKNFNLIKLIDLMLVYRKYRGERNKIIDIMQKLLIKYRKWGILQDNLFGIFSINRKNEKLLGDKRKRGKRNKVV